MNCVVRSKVHRVQKGSFTAENGERREYAKVTIVDTYNETDNDVGYKYASISVDVSQFGALKDALKKGVDIDFNIEINTSAKGEISRKVVAFKEYVPTK